mgnify:CR=1 FL=1
MNCKAKKDYNFYKDFDEDDIRAYGATKTMDCDALRRSAVRFLVARVLGLCAPWDDGSASRTKGVAGGMEKFYALVSTK